jgi:hypothetical protein
VFYLFIIFFLKLFLTTLILKVREVIYDVEHNPMNPFTAWERYLNSVFFDLNYGDFNLMLNSGIAYDNIRYSWDKKVDSFFYISMSPQPKLSRSLRKF